MNIAIIGAGFTGLSAAYQLQKLNHQVTIFEKDDRPGGLALGFKEKNWDWTLEQYYHHWFTSDDSVLNLAHELNYPVIIKRPKTSSLINGEIYQLDSPLTLLKFEKLNLAQRLRMAAVLGFLRFDPFWQTLEKVTATSFLSKTMGQKPYDILWKPLLYGKFADYTNSISLAWFWARIKKRTSSLAYPEGGFLNFAQTLAQKITDSGGQIHYNTTIDKIKPLSKNKLTLSFSSKPYAISNKPYDSTLVTLPSFAFLKLMPELPQAYQTKLTSLKGLGAIVMVLRLKEQFLTDGTYWLNICDTKIPILAIVEHTNFMDSIHYNNEHLVYVGNYLPHDHKFFSLNKDQLLKIFDPHLQKLHPDYQKNLIGTELFKVPFAQPIVPVNYSKIIPSIQTPIKNVYLANMQQVYPWDRGTNYAVELGEKAARILDDDKT